MPPSSRRVPRESLLVHLPDVKHRVGRGQQPARRVKAEPEGRVSLGWQSTEPGRVERPMVRFVKHLVIGPLEPGHVRQVGKPRGLGKTGQELGKLPAEVVQVPGSGRVRRDIAGCHEAQEVLADQPLNHRVDRPQGLRQTCEGVVAI